MCQNQIPRLCKLYSFREKKPEEFLRETDVDSSFYHNILDILQSLVDSLHEFSKTSDHASKCMQIP